MVVNTIVNRTGSHEVSAFEVYEEIREEVQQIFRSRLQTEIILALGEGNKTLSSLRDVTGSTSQAVIPKIRKLESMHLMEKE